MFVLIGISFSSCEKQEKDTDSEPESVPVPDPYALPWNTQNIRFEFPWPMCYHGAGFEVYYKDRLVLSKCEQQGGYSVPGQELVNDSVYHFFSAGIYSSAIYTTRKGGYKWQKRSTGPNYADYVKFHTLMHNLSYCFSENMYGESYLTGIGLSNLSVKYYPGDLTPGTHYVSDKSTGITNMDLAVFLAKPNVLFVISFD